MIFKFTEHNLSDDISLELFDSNSNILTRVYYTDISYSDLDEVCDNLNNLINGDNICEISYLKSYKLNNGYATKTLNYLLNELKLKGFKYAYLYCSPYDSHVLKLNELKLFYEKFGFSEIFDFGNGFGMLLELK